MNWHAACGGMGELSYRLPLTLIHTHTYTHILTHAHTHTHLHTHSLTHTYSHTHTHTHTHSLTHSLTYTHPKGLFQQMVYCVFSTGGLPCVSMVIRLSQRETGFCQVRNVVRKRVDMQWYNENNTPYPIHLHMIYWHRLLWKVKLGVATVLCITPFHFYCSFFFCICRVP